MSNTSMLALVDAEITRILEDPQGNYTLQGTAFTPAQYYEFLRKQRKDLIDAIEIEDEALAAGGSQEVADISTMTFDIDVNEFGEDNGQYES